MYRPLTILHRATLSNSINRNTYGLIVINNRETPISFLEYRSEIEEFQDSQCSRNETPSNLSVPESNLIRQVDVQGETQFQATRRGSMLLFLMITS